MQETIRLSVLGFSFNQSNTGTYGLVLGEVGGLRRLVVVIGTPEAQAIAFQLQNSQPPRPLTHDLLCFILNVFDIELLNVMIYKYEEGVFFSKLILKQEGKSNVEIECRTSDAINIALRMGAVIYTTEAIMKSLSVVFDENAFAEERKEEQHAGTLFDYSLLEDAELKNMLDKAIRDEDYELAALLRDELKNRGM